MPPRRAIKSSSSSQEDASAVPVPPKPVKKLSKLSSFQSTLAFAPAPPRQAAESTPRNAEDRRRSASASMPPPPVPLKRQKREAAIEPSARDKGKGKAKEVIVIDDDDDDDDDGDVKMRSVNEEVQGTEVMEMWTERFAPTKESELAPSKPRITKLRHWLLEALEGVPSYMIGRENEMSKGAKDKIRKYRRVLLLTGPAGVGKTTTLKVLASELGLELIEWGDGIEEWSLGGDGITRESAASKLASFLSRHSYAPLDLTSASSTSSSSSSSSQTSKRRLLVISSLPNLTHPSTREAFHTALQQFGQSYQASSCPLVIISSASGDGGRAEESWQDRERGDPGIGKEIRDGSWCQTLDFLPIAPTFLIKALNRIVPLAYPKTSARPPPEALQLIAQSSNGDLRSAVNSLEFLAAQTIPKMQASGAKKTGRGSRGGRGAKIDASEHMRALLDAVSRREQSLGLFHALGKVFYNKRLDDPPVDTDDQEDIARFAAMPPPPLLPEHLAEFDRRRSRIDMEHFIATVPVDSSTFSLWLHQSFPQFCTDIDQVSLALDDFSRADCMRTDEDLWQSSPSAIAYAFHILTRGLLMALPSPVPRNGQKVIKPAFFESFRREKATRESVNTVAAHLASRAVSSNNWAGLQSPTVLITETIPLMAKIQIATRNTNLLPPNMLSVTTYAAHDDDNEELTEKMEVEDEELPKPEEQESLGWYEAEVQDEKTFLPDDDITEF